MTATPDREAPVARDPRSIVFERLGRQAARWPDLAIESIDPGSSELPDRERSFARAFELAAISRWRTLEAVLLGCTTRSWSNIEPPVRGALIGGAAQLLFMDGIPDHAAVDETVNWAKRNIRQGAGNFVNGVLRSLIRLRGEELPATDEDAGSWWKHRDLIPLESGGALHLREAILPDDHATRLAIQASLGDELLLSWVGSVGWEAALMRARHCLARAPIVIHRKDGESYVWKGTQGSLHAELQGETESRVQDRTSAAAVESTSMLQPRLIVDYCAGRGTKTRQLALRHPNAEILAYDKDPERRKDLARAFKGHAKVRVVQRQGCEDAIGRVDLLLLDVPCSNSGVLPRRPQARYRFNEERTRSLVQLQKQIVTESSVLLAPGGHMLYTTCSLEPMENERQVSWIRKRFEAEVLKERRHEPSGLPGDPPEAYSDGGFHALLTRGGEGAS